MYRWLKAAAIAAIFTFSLAAFVAKATGYPGRPDEADAAAFFGVIIFGVTIARGAVLLTRFAIRREPHPLASWGKAMVVALPAYVATFTGTALVALFLASISWLKSMMPVVVPFWADRVLGGYDRLLFGGHPPLPAWPLFTVPYAGWQVVHMVTILWVLHWREGAAKDRAVIALLSTWGIGMILAYIFSSAGPVFTGQANASGVALIEARYLWANYRSSGAVIGGGISAFPSMHVAIAYWVAFVLSLRGVRWIGPIFVVLISAGAVALGWHYSADVLAGLLVALAGIAVSKPFVLRSGEEQQTRPAGACLAGPDVSNQPL
jgi:hypothetical protein